ASREDVALRLIVTSSGSDAVRVGQQFEVHQRCTIGRRTELAVSLDDGHLSARHAELAPRAGTWFLRDLGSTNGTRLNGAPVESELRVAPGDFIELGSVTLQIAKSS
ncbi:MAG: FHA domain-containing protein, partial [Chloroflexota bacterium]